MSEYEIKWGRIYPLWMWWFLDKYSRVFKNEYWSAVRGDGWSCLLFEKRWEREQ